MYVSLPSLFRFWRANTLAVFALGLVLLTALVFGDFLAGLCVQWNPYLVHFMRNLVYPYLIGLQVDSFSWHILVPNERLQKFAFIFDPAFYTLALRYYFYDYPSLIRHAKSDKDLLRAFAEAIRASFLTDEPNRLRLVSLMREDLKELKHRTGSIDDVWQKYHLENVLLPLYTVFPPSLEQHMDFIEGLAHRAYVFRNTLAGVFNISGVADMLRRAEVFGYSVLASGQLVNLSPEELRLFVASAKKFSDRMSWLESSGKLPDFPSAMAYRVRLKPERFVLEPSVLRDNPVFKFPDNFPGQTLPGQYEGLTYANDRRVDVTGDYIVFTGQPSLKSRITDILRPQRALNRKALEESAMWLEYYSMQLPREMHPSHEMASQQQKYSLGHSPTKGSSTSQVFDSIVEFGTNVAQSTVEMSSVTSPKSLCSGEGCEVLTRAANLRLQIGASDKINGRLDARALYDYFLANPHVFADQLTYARLEEMRRDCMKRREVVLYMRDFHHPSVSNLTPKFRLEDMFGRNLAAGRDDTRAVLYYNRFCDFVFPAPTANQIAGQNPLVSSWNNNYVETFMSAYHYEILKNNPKTAALIKVHLNNQKLHYKDVLDGPRTLLPDKDLDSLLFRHPDHSYGWKPSTPHQAITVEELEFQLWTLSMLLNDPKVAGDPLLVEVYARALDDVKRRLRLAYKNPPQHPDID